MGMSHLKGKYEIMYSCLHHLRDVTQYHSYMLHNILYQDQHLYPT